MKTLPPIKETIGDFEELERRIIEFFRKEIYLPLIEALGKSSETLQNARDDLLTAIQSGQIYFSRGQFRGQFNSMISRELKKLGAKWDRTQGSWKIPFSILPIEVKNAISVSESKFAESVRKIDRKLSQILPEKIADSLKLEDIFDSTLFQVNEKFKKSIRGITIAPELTKAERAKIAEAYTKNMRLYIKDWTEKEIVKLRKEVQVRAFTGIRYESLVKTIERSYGVSQSKAKFLARQETGILMAKFKQVRYESAGIDEYIWATVAGSAKHPVRPMHKKLDGKKFRWNDPPIVNKKGDRKNPGEDYGCRCFAKPVVRF